jgi:hypothetical protein
MFTIVFVVLALVAATVRLLASSERRSGQRIAEVLLLYWFSVAIGLTGIFEFAGHTFLADRVAASIGWPAGSPFQQEVAFADLALGVLGILCVRIRGNFWIATTVAATVMQWGDAAGHIVQMVRYGNHHPGNAGAVLWANILIPAVAIGLLIYRSHAGSFERPHQT